jgi:hypothetical protein
LAVEATQAANDALDAFDAAEAIYLAKWPNSHSYPDAQTYLDNSNAAIDERRAYAALALIIIRPANDALDAYDAAEAIYLANDPTPYYADAQTYLDNSNTAIDAGDADAALAAEATQAANDALDAYDAAEAEIENQIDILTTLSQVDYSECLDYPIIEDLIAECGAQQIW